MFSARIKYLKICLVMWFAYNLLVCTIEVFAQEEVRLTRYTTTTENNFWLNMINRAPVLTPKIGILHTYDSRMDNEYWIDFLSYNFSMRDDSSYVESANAFRAMSGSINSSRFFTEGGFKVSYEVEEKIFFEANYTHRQSYQEDHNVLLVTLGRSKLWDLPLSFYGNIALETDKEDMDFIVGLKWEPIEKLNLDFQMVVLDFLNNALNGGGGISTHQQADKRMFERQPYAFRLRSSYEWENFRFEFFGALDTPEKTDITFEDRQYDDFKERIRYAYTGGKIERQWNDSFTTGVYANYRMATHQRLGEEQNDFKLNEEYAEVGLYALFQYNEKWYFESEWTYTNMYTKRVAFTDEIQLNRNDWAFLGKTMAFWQFNKRWQLQTGIAFDRRVMATLEEKYPLDGFNMRLIWGIRYQLRSNFFIQFTNNISLEEFYAYDGSSIAMQLTW